MKYFVMSVVMAAIVMMGGPNKLMPIGMHCAMMIPGVIAQGTQLPPAGNPGHEEPIPGANCVHDDKDPAHNCACHRECKQNTDGEGNPASGGYVQEDPMCRVYCYKDHCHCPIHNCE